jgi:hypothetical protein
MEFNKEIKYNAISRGESELSNFNANNNPMKSQFMITGEKIQ